MRKAEQILKALKFRISNSVEYEFMLEMIEAIIDEPKEPSPEKQFIKAGGDAASKAVDEMITDSFYQDGKGNEINLSDLARLLKAVEMIRPSVEFMGDPPIVNRLEILEHLQETNFKNLNDEIINIHKQLADLEGTQKAADQSVWGQISNHKRRLWNLEASEPITATLEVQKDPRIKQILKRLSSFSKRINKNNSAIDNINKRLSQGKNKPCNWTQISTDKYNTGCCGTYHFTVGSHSYNYCPCCGKKVFVKSLFKGE